MLLLAVGWQKKTDIMLKINAWEMENGKSTTFPLDGGYVTGGKGHVAMKIMH